MNLQQTLDQSGFVIIENVGLENPNEALHDTITSISEPISYLGLPLVMDLKPQPGFQPASFAGTGVFDLHTDLSWHEKPPKYLGMFCVMPESAGGGIPLLADGWQALAQMDPADVQFLRSEAVSFPPPSHIDYAPLSGPIVSGQDDQPFIRFRYDMLTDPPPPVSRFNQAINDCRFEVRVPPGTIYLFDNYRMLHGRTGLAAGMNSDRHYKRIYGDV